MRALGTQFERDDEMTSTVDEPQQLPDAIAGALAFSGPPFRDNVSSLT